MSGSYNTPRRLPAKGILIAFLALLILGGITALAITRGWLKPPQTQAPIVTDELNAVTPVGLDRVVHFVAGGDLNITDKVVNSGLYGDRYDFSQVFRDVMPEFAGADLSTLNLEGNLYGAPYGTLHNSAPQELVDALRNAGVDILQTANSKSINNGILGLTSTISGIRNAGMEPLGTYADTQEFQRYQGFMIREVNGIRIAITAFTKGMDGRGLPEGSEDCVNLLYTDYNSTYQKIDEAGIKAVLSAINAQKPDLTIALLHWGSEFNDQTSKSQTQLCKLLAENGVDALIGTHPHYVQKMGFDQETSMFIAYSLGDFCGDGDKSGTNYSVLLNLEITKDGKTGKTTITDYDYTPIFHYEDASGRIRLLRIREAMTAYEQRFIDAVPKEVYDAMATALKRIETRVNGE